MPLTPSFTGMGQARPISQDEEVLAHALNYSQAAIIGLRNEQRMTQEATNAVIAMVSDPQEFGGDVWIFNGYQKPMYGNQSIPSSIVKESDPSSQGALHFHLNLLSVSTFGSFMDGIWAQKFARRIGPIKFCWRRGILLTQVVSRSTFQPNQYTVSVFLESCLHGFDF